MLTVTVDESPALKPVTVIKPVPLIAAEPAETETFQLKPASKLETWIVKPSLVLVGVPNVGVRADFKVEPETVAEPAL